MGRPAKRPTLESSYGTSWLDDEVIDLFCATVASSVVAPFSVFWRVAIDQACLGCAANHLQDQHVPEKTVWLLPYNRSSKHWALFVVLWRAKSIIHLDSLYGPPDAADTAAFQRLMQVAGAQLDWRGWRLVVPSSTPRQEDGSSCGAHVCWHAETVAKGVTRPFRDEDMRQRIRQRIWNVRVTLTLLYDW